MAGLSLKGDKPSTYAEDVLVASAARGASGDSGAIEGFEVANTLRLQLNATAASGTSPTLDVVVEDSVDGGATWNTIATFAQLTAAGRQVVNVTSPFGGTLRVRWTIAGTTPSFTFEVRSVAQSMIAG